MSTPTPTRDRIVTAAAALLDEAGEPAVTLRAVGARVGLSRGAPYRHFADRAALLRGVAAADLAGLGALVQEAVGAETDPRAALRRLLRAHLAWARAHPERYRLMFSAEIRAATEDDVVRAAGDAHAAFAAAVGALRPAPPAGAAALLFAAAHGAAVLEHAGHLGPDGPWEARADAIVDALLDRL